MNKQEQIEQRVKRVLGDIEKWEHNPLKDMEKWEHNPLKDMEKWKHKPLSVPATSPIQGSYTPPDWRDRLEREVKQHTMAIHGPGLTQETEPPPTRQQHRLYRLNSRKKRTDIDEITSIFRKMEREKQNLAASGGLTKLGWGKQHTQKNRAGLASSLTNSELITLQHNHQNDYRLAQVAQERYAHGLDNLKVD